LPARTRRGASIERSLFERYCPDATATPPEKADYLHVEFGREKPGLPVIE